MSFLIIHFVKRRQLQKCCKIIVILLILLTIKCALKLCQCLLNAKSLHHKNVQIKRLVMSWKFFKNVNVFDLKMC